MDLYFSGVAAARERNLLKTAGVNLVLVDPSDLRHVVERSAECCVSQFARVALDSGAYANFTHHRAPDLDGYIQRIHQYQGEGLMFDFITTLDVVGDPAASKANWLAIRAAGLETMPVWTWDSPPADLAFYLDQSERVGVGGLVPHLRSRRAERLSRPAQAEWDEQRQMVVDQLLKVSQAQPRRLHAFGLAWHKAIEQLAPYLRSADSYPFCCQL